MERAARVGHISRRGSHLDFDESSLGLEKTRVLPPSSHFTLDCFWSYGFSGIVVSALEVSAIHLPSRSMGVSR
jgi:hypothetical protein